mgnify:FL=1
MPSIGQDEFEASYELIECRECGTQFNLGAQMYYDNLCPSCKNKA